MARKERKREEDYRDDGKDLNRTVVSRRLHIDFVLLG